MKNINGFWVDENNNSWNASKYTKEKAEAISRGMQECRNCRNCQDCQDCRNCWNCRDCWNCEEFQANPQTYITPKIGSRKDQTIFYWNNSKTRVICGCFRGTLPDFEKRVKNAYPPKSKHFKKYQSEIRKVKYLMGMERREECL